MVCQHPGGGLGRHLQPPSQHASVPLLTERACGGPGGHQQRAQAGRRRPAVDAGRGGLFPDRERAGGGGGGGVLRRHAAAHRRGYPAHHARLPGALGAAALEAGGALSCAPLTLLRRASPGGAAAPPRARPERRPALRHDQQQLPLLQRVHRVCRAPGRRAGRASQGAPTAPAARTLCRAPRAPAAAAG